MHDRLSGVAWLQNSLGSAFLAAIVIGSGIAAQQLSPGNVGLQLFENAAATAAGLFAIILMFGGVSVPTSTRWSRSSMPPSAACPGATPRPTCRRKCRVHRRCRRGQRDVLPAAVSISTKHRASGPHFLSEIVATLGLLLVIFALARTDRSRQAPAAVGRLHRGGVLLHQLDQLRQPGDHRRANVL